ncbi:hypothetical protein ACFOU2_14360 [Bacillus songklensis]|uniref:Uncharacterized protein n=1 Tax=Bacillus songklensis TaxID=1069116 RepID=A0ABV8B2Y5_9BACI
MLLKNEKRIKKYLNAESRFYALPLFPLFCCELLLRLACPCKNFPFPLFLLTIAASSQNAEADLQGTRTPCKSAYRYKIPLSYCATEIMFICSKVLSLYGLHQLFNIIHRFLFYSYFSDFQLE